MQTIRPVMVSLFFCLICFGVVGQESGDYLNKHGKIFGIGDTLPDLEFYTPNSEPKSLKLSDFHNKKLIIIDYWASWCTTCVNRFPRLDSLQTKFDYLLQILLANDTVRSRDTEAKAVRALKKQSIKLGKKIDLPILFGDLHSLELFPFFRSIPHYIWIDGNRKIVAITSSKEVNEENLLEYLNNQELNLPVKTH